MSFVTRRTLVVLALVATAIAITIVALPDPFDRDASARVHLRADSPAVTATPTPAPPRDTTITVSARAVGRPVAPGFVGVSIEYSALSAYTGENPHAVDPVFEQLLRNLSPGSPPQVRIGGNSSDSTWWPVPGMAKPKGINYTLTPRWFALARSLSVDTGAKLVLGVDLALGGPPLAAAEARALLHRVGTRHVAALEIGNEPLRYALFPWYRNAAGKLVYIRPRDYDYADFSRDFARVAAVMPTGATLAGPTFGGMSWMTDLPSFMAAEPRVRLITDHVYPLNRCWTKPGDPHYPTTARLLSTYSSRHVIAGLERYIALAHANGDRFRIGEMQSIACGGKFGISDTFAAALWSMDTLFNMARAGVDGVNLHTYAKAAYALFHFTRTAGRWQGTPSPEYYGLVMFAKAAPAGSRLLLIRRAGSRAIRAWATRGADGAVRILLINDDLHRAHTIAVRQPLTSAPATVMRLTAPSVGSTSGVTLGGASFGPTTGRLGTLHLVHLRAGAHGRLQVTLPAASAALITLG